MATKGSKKDFDAPTLVRTTEDHEERLKSLEERIGAVERRVGTNEVFGRTFFEARESTKSIDEGIFKAIDAHDSHNLIKSGLALLKWLAVLIIGGVIGAWIKSLF